MICYISINFSYGVIRMLDNRIYTFVKLCEMMNYRKTAEVLNMTQPAVTQHIQYLEKDYNCKLFNYDGRTLSKTKAADLIEKYARSAIYNDTELRKSLDKSPIRTIRFGVTKTIGDYVIGENLSKVVKEANIRLSLLVDNTANLLNMLDNTLIDIALIEGFFNKSNYGYKLYRAEKFIGICSKHHPFNNKSVTFDDILNETLIHREEGSGTRAIFEEILHENNYTIDNFKNTVCISTFELIKKLVTDNVGISFVYKAVADSNKDLGIFELDGTKIYRDFNYVYLKNTVARESLAILENYWN